MLIRNIDPDNQINEVKDNLTKIMTVLIKQKKRNLKLKKNLKNETNDTWKIMSEKKKKKNYSKIISKKPQESFVIMHAVK